MRKFFSLIGLGVLGVTLLLVAVYPSRTPYSPTNTSWNGLSDAAAEWQMTPVPSLNRLPPGAPGTVLVLIPVLRLDTSDVDHIRRYLNDGGRVVLLSDVGFGNDVLAGLGLPIRLAGPPILDTLFNEGHPRLPKIPSVPLLPPGSALVLYDPTALAGTSGMAIVAESSPFAFLNRGTGRADPGSPRGPFVVAAWAAVGRGTLYVVSSPSILINGLIGHAANRAFTARVFAGRRVLLDTAHLPVRSLDRARAGLHAAATLAAGAPVMLGLLLAGVVGPLVRLLRRREGDG